MDALKRQRAVLKGQVTRIVTFCEAPGAPLAQCKVRQTRLEQHMREFEIVQNEIEALVEGEEQLAEETRYRAEFEETFYEVHAKLSDNMQRGSSAFGESESDINQALKSLAENQSSLNQIVKTLVDSPRRPINITKQELPARLPEIKLPEFSGRFDEWVRFRDLFTALVASKDSLSEIEKLEYLQTRLKGNAASIVKHLPLSNENFNVAWTSLQLHSNKPHFIMVAHLDNLFEQPILKHGSLEELKRFFSAITENMNALTALKIAVDSWDTLLIYVLSKKLDGENKVLWVRSIKGKVHPSIPDFVGFLEERINELESLQLSRSVRTVTNKASVGREQEKRVLSATAPVCDKCHQRHFLYQCAQFRNLTVQGRCEFVNSNSICPNCLRSKHLLTECKFSNCKMCGLKHNTMLHADNGSTHPIPSTSSGISRGLVINSAQLCREYLTILPTATVLIKDCNGEFQRCRALLDSGSQATLITEACMQRLGLKRAHAKIPIVGVGNSGNHQGTRGKVLLAISSPLAVASTFSAQAFVLSHLTNELPSVNIPSSSLAYFADLVLADESCLHPSKIDILLGADIFFKILAEGKVIHPSGSPIAQNTIFGWVIAGSISSRPNAALHIFHSTMDLDVLLKQFFEFEEFKGPHRIGNEVSASVEDHFASTHCTNAEGRFVVRLPFNKTPVEFGDSRETALKLLYAMERRFDKDPELKRDYSNFMSEYERLGHMALVPQDELDRPSFYLPHHAVLKPDSTTTKLRVVFNASAKSTNGYSLNDYLLVGPTIQNDLFTCTIKFRKGVVAVKADIAKMYRQILIYADDVNFQRIVWREHASDKPRDYALLTVTYGTASAAFLATRVLKQIGLNSMAKFPRASNCLINDFYVDDMTATFDDVAEAIEVKNDLCLILRNAGMDLRKWSSNSADFNKTIDEDLREPATELCMGETGVKTLGILWDTKRDVFRFSIAARAIGSHATKREVLSDIARIFDPLGWLSPVTVNMKLFIKRLWIKEVGWDEIMPAEFQQEWCDIKADLSSLKSVYIPRWMQSRRGEALELHGFADASESAYAAAIYSRVIKAGGVQTTLICAKTRVAPVKPSLSIPRLELCGALLLSKLLSKVKDALAIHDIECYAYTDSSAVLYWIQGYPRARNVFVDNRISQIVAQFPPSIWHYVRSIDNPADCATRGLMPRKLLDLNMWWNGPSFLRDTVITFSVLPGAKERPVEDKPFICLTNSMSDREWDIFERFSNLNRLLRVVARCIRLFRNRASSLESAKGNGLSVLDIRAAKTVLVKHAQMHAFRDEINALERGQVVSNKGKYATLNPFIDPEGVLRVGGRLENAQIPFNQRHPIILHKDHHLTRLIVNDNHLSNMHAGLRQMTYLLSLYYCVPGIHHIIKRCIYQCTTCRRQRAVPFQQQMANLPKQRLEPGVTFGNTGVDYAGPFIVRSWRGRGAKQYKAYVALFVCLATKALHLELVSDLSSLAFIAALRRFVARRGKCHTIFSDNGTNFIGANQHLRDWANLLHSTQFQEDVCNELTTRGITWQFAPPYAPHFGGLWEAGVKTVKFHIRRILGQASLTYEEFATILCQIEACANSRPLCTRFEGDVDPLTPAHFLISRPMSAVPEPELLPKKISLVNRWQYLQHLVQTFWRKWSQDYLSQLRKRPKWLLKHKNLQLNDIVLVKDENLPPCRWLVGRVSKTYPGSDGLVRVASIITSRGELKRPLCKLCPLLVDES